MNCSEKFWLERYLLLSVLNFLVTIIPLCEKMLINIQLSQKNVKFYMIRVILHIIEISVSSYVWKIIAFGDDSLD